MDFLSAEEGNYGKIKQLHDKWQEINHEIDREKQSRRDSVEQQLQLVEDKIHQKRQADQARITELRGHIDTVNQIVSGQKSGRRGFIDERERTIRQIETELNQSIQSERKNIQAKQQHFTQQSDERILSLMEQLATMEGENNKELEMGMVQARNKITDLEATILQQRKKRQEATTQVTENIESDLNRLHNALAIQKKVREETQGKLYRMIEEVHKKLLEELNTERRQRQQMNQAMLQLLEETCSKVERNFR